MNEREHYHCCLKCGVAWQHVTPDDSCTREEWEAAHTCKNGHECTVKVPAQFARLITTVKDPVAYARVAWPRLAQFYEEEGHT